MKNIGLNNQLNELYKEFLLKFEQGFDEHEKQDLSLPLLMYVFPDYFKVKYKILFVGKETYDWYGNMAETEKLNVSYLVRCYKQFEFAVNYRGKNSPFWRFLHSFYKKINPKSPRNGFLWTNISKIDYNKTTPTREIQEKGIEGFKLLKEEIRITKPDIVIFLTSWKYDNKLREIFNDITFEIIEPRKLSKLRHKDLPNLSFRTYHPNYLSRSGQFADIINKIESHIPPTLEIPH